ncbi:MAG: protein often found in actinomycetes clustered with signal peptidase and/or RNaseHII [Actinobacteria bacterium]|nr:MAG: protein often found in actinomycetes clustered with signal peptidase and/or RNaseHII [Actinomycetota bacterium]
MSSDEIEGYENSLELELFREYRDVVSMFQYVVETERRFYLCNAVDIQPRAVGNDVFFELTLTDAWVWDIYRPSRLVKTVRVITYKDVNVEELSKPDFESL